MRDLDLTTLRLFVSVCEARNISRAAEASAIAGSAISKRLSALERQWGTRLLVRRRHGVEPTPAGETLLSHARGLLAAAQRAQRDLSDHAQGVRGHVRVVASASALGESLVFDVAAFLKIRAHQNIRIDLEEAISPDISRRVREGEAALGIAWDAADLDGLQTDPYIGDDLAVSVPLGHPLAGRARVAFADTLAWDHVGLPVTSNIHRIVMQAAAASGVLLQPRIVTGNHESALRAVEAGLAIALTPLGIAQQYTRRERICTIPLTDAWAHRQFVICHHAPALLSAAARALLGFLRERRHGA